MSIKDLPGNVYVNSLAISYEQSIDCNRTIKLTVTLLGLYSKDYNQNLSSPWANKIWLRA